LSEPNPESSDAFQKHFEGNYDGRVGSYIRWAKRQILATKMLVVVFAFIVVATLLQTAIAALAPTLASIAIYTALVYFVCWFGFIVYSGRLMEGLKVKEKDILVYFLLHAAEKYQAFLKEGDQQEFLDECVVEISAFVLRLDNLLSNAEMPLKLPNIAQLKDFNENVKNKIIPALRQRKDYPAFPQGRNYSEVFVSLAKLFFYEKGYEELPEINKTINEKLKDIETEPEQAKGNRIKRSFASRKVLLPISFVVLTSVVLLIVYVLRAMGTEATPYWSYVAENAAPISVGIVAGWAAIIVVLYRKSETKE
jgi:hypothetical protein